MEPPKPDRGVANAVGLLADDGTVADKLFAVTALEDGKPCITGPLLTLALPGAALPLVPEGTAADPRIDR